ncbi:hypothetical protein [Streptomyces sp. NPDC096132]|uniref:hypothetical protein n=1 Tax=Streptomyces sp. NPDC096132 TaxID=3366075 RepID=UPI0037F767C7
MRPDEVLHIRLGLSKMRHDLCHAAVRRSEQLQTRHLPLLDSKIENVMERQVCFREDLRASEDAVSSYVRATDGQRASRQPQGSPNPTWTELFDSQRDLDDNGYIKVASPSTRTKIPAFARDQ